MYYPPNITLQGVWFGNQIYPPPSTRAAWAVWDGEDSENLKFATVLCNQFDTLGGIITSWILLKIDEIQQQMSARIWWKQTRCWAGFGLGGAKKAQEIPSEKAATNNPTSHKPFLGQFFWEGGNIPLRSMRCTAKRTFSTSARDRAPSSRISLPDTENVKMWNRYEWSAPRRANSFRSYSGGISGGHRFLGLVFLAPQGFPYIPLGATLPLALYRSPWIWQALGTVFPGHGCENAACQF